MNKYAMVSKRLLAIFLFLALSTNYAMAARVVDKEHFALDISGELAAKVEFTMPYKKAYVLKAHENETSDEICKNDPSICIKGNWNADFSAGKVAISKVTFKPIYKINEGLQIYLEKDVEVEKIKDSINQGITLGIGGSKMYGDFTVRTKDGYFVYTKYELAEIKGITAYADFGFNYANKKNRYSSADLKVQYKTELANNLELSAYLRYYAQNNSVYEVIITTPEGEEIYQPWDQTLTAGAGFKFAGFSAGFSYSFNYQFPVDNLEEGIFNKKYRQPFIHTIGLSAGYEILKELSVTTGLSAVIREAPMVAEKIYLDENSFEIYKKSRLDHENILNFDIGLAYELIEDLKFGTKFTTSFTIHKLPLDEDGNPTLEDSQRSTQAIPRLNFYAEYKF